MPSYEYICKECKNTTIHVRSINDEEPKILCPTCKIRMNKVYLFGSIKFNGNGFYSTDK